jgi:hypothetical protein
VAVPLVAGDVGEPAAVVGEPPPVGVPVCEVDGVPVPSCADAMFSAPKLSAMASATPVIPASLIMSPFS